MSSQTCYNDKISNESRKWKVSLSVGILGGGGGRGVSPSVVVQKCPNYKMCRTQYRQHPHPQPGPRPRQGHIIFFIGNPLRISLRTSRLISNLASEAEILVLNMLISGRQYQLSISASRSKSLKNCLGDPLQTQRGFHRKSEPTCSSRLGFTGVAIDFGFGTFCNSGTSVQFGAFITLVRRS